MCNLHQTMAHQKKKNSILVTIYPAVIYVSVCEKDYVVSHREKWNKSGQH